MPAFTWSQFEREPVDPEHSSATGSVLRGETFRAGLVRYPAGTAVTPHARPHEQIHSILKGKARFRVGREEALVGPGSAVLIRPHTEYAVEVLEDLEVVAFEDTLPPAPAGRGAASGTPFFEWSEMASDFITPKYSSGRGPVVSGDRMEVAYMFYPAGTEAKPHSHPNEQVQVCLEGKIRAVIGGEEYTVVPGGGLHMPPNVEHGIRILEDYTTINCKDIVQGFSVYHARWEK